MKQVEVNLVSLCTNIGFMDAHNTQYVYHVVEPQDRVDCLSGTSVQSSKPTHLSRAGAPDDKNSGLIGHVVNGSKPGWRSKFISCTLDQEWALHFQIQ